MLRHKLQPKFEICDLFVGEADVLIDTITRPCAAAFDQLEIVLRGLVHLIERAPVKPGTIRTVCLTARGICRRGHWAPKGGKLSRWFPMMTDDALLTSRAATPTTATPTATKRPPSAWTQSGPALT